MVKNMKLNKKETSIGIISFSLLLERLRGGFWVVIVFAVLVGCKDQTKTPEKKTFPYVNVPLLYTDQQMQADFLLTHFWDKFDFNDTTWVGSAESITEQALVEYISILPYAPYDVICMRITDLLDKADNNPVMYAYFSARLEYYFSEPNSQLRTDEYYVPVLEHMIASKSLDEPRKTRPNTILPLVNKNRPGMQAANINFTGISGAKSQLTNVKADYILVIFYNFDCEDCNVVKKLIGDSEVINEMQQRRKLAILAIYPGANMEGWKVSSPQIPASWINGYDHDEEIAREGTYVLRSIPTLYLIDKDYTVILKEPSVEYVEYFFNSILNR